MLRQFLNQSFVTSAVIFIMLFGILIPGVMTLAMKKEEDRKWRKGLKIGLGTAYMIFFLLFSSKSFSSDYPSGISLLYPEFPFLLLLCPMVLILGQLFKKKKRARKCQTIMVTLSGGNNKECK